jgi:hypothetical protein
MYSDTGFGGICQGDFPEGSLRNDFQAIADQMSMGTESQFDSISTMCDERARRVIEQICTLSADVSLVLGGQK